MASESGVSAPESTFISVDLPAPFSRPAHGPPGLQREVDALQGLYSAEALLDAAHLQKGHELS